MLSVSALSEQLKTLLELHFQRIHVEGELSRVTHHGSGHWYFTLKDAEASIRCVLFKMHAAKLRFIPQEGMRVSLYGAITLYKPRGEYQITVTSMEPYGQGERSRALEALKEKLQAKGYFDPARKKPFPPIPRHLILITSATGAALQDMLRVASARWPLVRLSLIDVLVQGEHASAQIAKALGYADTLSADGIVLARGGGSVEDLWAFNEECVADALYAMQTPVISAIGHEIDWVLSDHVASMRAPTPSAAMEMILPDRYEWLERIEGYTQQYHHRMDEHLRHKQETLTHLQGSFGLYGMPQRLERARERVGSLCEHYDHALQNHLRRAQEHLALLHHQYTLAHPRTHQRLGYVQIVQDKQLVDLGALGLGERFGVINAECSLTAEVVEIGYNNGSI